MLVLLSSVNPPFEPVPMLEGPIEVARILLGGVTYLRRNYGFMSRSALLTGFIIDVLGYGKRPS